MTFLRVPWRNLWRNRRRTCITIAAVSFNTMVLITTFCLMDGLLDQTVRNATQLMTGEAQLHAPGYLADHSLYKTIDKPDPILVAIKERSIDAASRTYGYGLVSQGTKSAGAMFWGIDPTAETKTFDLATHMGEGAFLSQAPTKGVVLGKKLARSLNARVGTEIVVLVQAADGSMGNDLFTVQGILKAVGDSVDRNAAILHLADFRALFTMPKGIHEIAVNAKGRLPLQALKEQLERLAPDAEVKTWHQLLPTLSDMIQLSDANMILFGAIFFLAAGLGVMNTMLMATYERAREFGLLKALGASPWLIVRDVATEAWLLAAVSTLFGVLAGSAASYALQVYGLDTSGLAGETTISGVVFDPVWRGALSFKSVLQPVLIMWVVCVLAALYPAAMSARMDPIKSMHQI
ncbi:MAG: ABC transporter permease [Syntrophobacteraceae bacterium]